MEWTINASSSRKQSALDVDLHEHMDVRFELATTKGIVTVDNRLVIPRECEQISLKHSTHFTKA